MAGRKIKSTVLAFDSSIDEKENERERKGGERWRKKRERKRRERERERERVTWKRPEKPAQGKSIRAMQQPRLTVLRFVPSSLLSLPLVSSRPYHPFSLSYAPIRTLLRADYGAPCQRWEWSTTRSTKFAIVPPFSLFLFFSSSARGCRISARRMLQHFLETRPTRFHDSLALYRDAARSLRQIFFLSIVEGSFGTVKADRGIYLRSKTPLDRGIQSGKGTDPETSQSNNRQVSRLDIRGNGWIQLFKYIESRVSTLRVLTLMRVEDGSFCDQALKFTCRTPANL